VVEIVKDRIEAVEQADPGQQTAHNQTEQISCHTPLSRMPHLPAKQ
jgi:hypothetical protein